jgi:hypothetical protein
MAGEIHYEVFFKKNSKAGWALYEAIDDRDKAIKVAEKLLAKSEAGSARVTKESFLEDEKTFRSIPIFEGGAEKLGKVEEKTGDVQLPCRTPDDLSRAHSRDTIRRVLSAWLERNRVIPMELLHRPDLVELLEGSNTDLQHAIQKVAIASAQDSDASAHGYMKQLNELVQKSLTRIYEDGRKKKLPCPDTSQSFPDVVSEVHAAGARPYMMRAAIVHRLRKASQYSDKLDALLEMADTLPTDTVERAFALSEVDSCLAEVISFDKGREAMLGACKDLGEVMERLACLYDGDDGAEALNMAPRAAKRLARKINDNDLDACRTGIAHALLVELERPKRLRPSSVTQEVRLARELAQKLVMSAGPLLPIDALNKAFISRSARLLQSDTIDEYLRYAADPDEELDKLISLEENMVGESNKLKLAGYIRGVLSGHNTDNHYIRGAGNPLTRLAALTTHQTRILSGGYPDTTKAEMSKTIDMLGMKIIDETKILNAVEGGDRPVLDKVTGLLRLATGGALPIGECSNDAQARALRHLKSQTGLAEAQTPDAKHKLRGIQSMLGQIAAQAKAA